MSYILHLRYIWYCL